MPKKTHLGDLIIHLKNVDKVKYKETKITKNKYGRDKSEKIVKEKIYNTVSYPIYSDYFEREYLGSRIQRTTINQVQYYLRKHNIKDNGKSAYLRGYSLLPVVMVNDVPHDPNIFGGGWKAKPNNKYYNYLRNLGKKSLKN